MGTLDLSAWSEQQLTLLLAATFLGIVLVVVALLVYIRRSRVQNSAAGAEEPGESGNQEKPPEIVLRRRHWTGPLELEIKGRAYRRIKDIEDGNLRRAILLAASDLVMFAGIAPPAPAREPQPSGVPSSAATRQYAPAKELAEHALLAQLEQANLGAEPPKGWIASLTRTLGPRRPSAEPGRLFVEEIETILQRRLKEAGVTVEVHLRTDGQGIVRVEVDGILYDSPGDVPDMTIRELIRASVGEWEARS